MAKPIYFSNHARQQMLLRGAEEEEVIAAIRSGNWQPAKNGKLHSRLQFGYDKDSPINQQFYLYKAVDAIFKERLEEIVVITVKVYYFN